MPTDDVQGMTLWEECSWGLRIFMWNSFGGKHTDGVNVCQWKMYDDGKCGMIPRQVNIAYECAVHVCVMYVYLW